MAYTYLETVNLALREINEVPLSEGQFLAARGLQQFAKESVNRAFFDISNQSLKWPWLQEGAANSACTEVREITVGKQWYDINPLNDGIKLEVDWNTFIMTEKDLVTNDPLVTPELVKNLPVITYDMWIELHRENDFGNRNLGEPKYVVRHPSGKFGISPIPDKSYWIEYNVSNSAVRFTTSQQEIPIPEEFITVLIARVKYYLWLFRENDTQANFSLGEYKEALSNMKHALLSNKSDYIRML